MNTKARVVSNLLVLGSSQVATWLLSTVYLVLLGRYLGPHILGELSLAGSIVSVLGLVVSLGMDTLITRTVARSPSRMGELLGAAVAVRVALAIPILGGLYVYTFVGHLNTETRLASLFLACGMLIASLSGALVAAMQGRERMSLAAIGAMLANLLDVGLALLVIRTHSGIVLFTALGIPIAGMIALMNLYWTIHLTQIQFRVRLRTVREMVCGGLAFWANSIFLTIYIYIDTVILGSLAGATAVGIYAPATRMFSVALFLPAIVGAATFPLLSRLGVERDTDFQRAGRKTLSVLIVCAIPLTVGLGTFAEPLILAIYGPAYRASAPVLVVLSLCIPATFLNIQAAQTLAAEDHQRRWTLVMALSCLVNPLLNWLLIPYAQQHWQNGALGAALSLLATEMFMMCYAIVILRRMLADASIIRVLRGSMLAGFMQVGALRLMAGFWPVVAQGAAFIVYTVVAIIFGALSRRDMGLILDVLRHRRRQSFREDVVAAHP